MTRPRGEHEREEHRGAAAAEPVDARVQTAPDDDRRDRDRGRAGAAIASRTVSATAASCATIAEHEQPGRPGSRADVPSRSRPYDLRPAGWRRRSRGSAEGERRDGADRSDRESAEEETRRGRGRAARTAAMTPAPSSAPSPMTPAPPVPGPAAVTVTVRRPAAKRLGLARLGVRSAGKDEKQIGEAVQVDERRAG